MPRVERTVLCVRRRIVKIASRSPLLSPLSLFAAEAEAIARRDAVDPSSPFQISVDRLPGVGDLEKGRVPLTGFARGDSGETNKSQFQIVPPE